MDIDQSAMEEEAREYFSKKVKPLLQKIVVSLLVTQPEDVVRFFLWKIV
jgi:hypothetical protein